MTPPAAAITGLLPDDDPDFAWTVHTPQAGDHLLVTCDVSDFWRTMPAQAVRTAIAQHIARWATALRPAFGVVPWGRDDQPEVLIVAADQATADLEAKLVAAYLAELNPPPPAPEALPECGCPEHGWHLIVCSEAGRPVLAAAS